MSFDRQGGRQMMHTRENTVVNKKDNHIFLMINSFFLKIELLLSCFFIFSFISLKLQQKWAFPGVSATGFRSTLQWHLSFFKNLPR